MRSVRSSTGQEAKKKRRGFFGARLQYKISLGIPRFVKSPALGRTARNVFWGCTPPEPRPISRRADAQVGSAQVDELADSRELLKWGSCYAPPMS